jgi:hypothetical protein
MFAQHVVGFITMWHAVQIALDCDDKTVREVLAALLKDLGRWATH